MLFRSHIQPRRETPSPPAALHPRFPVDNTGHRCPHSPADLGLGASVERKSQPEGRPPRCLCPAGGFGAQGPTGPQSERRRKAAQGDKGFWRRGPDLSTLPAAARRPQAGLLGPGTCPVYTVGRLTEAPGRASGARDLPCPHCRPPHGGPGEGFGRRGPALSTLPAAARRPQGGLPRDGRDPAEPRRGEGGRRRADPRMGGQGDRHAGTRASRTPPGTRIRDGDAGARERPGREDLGRHAGVPLEMHAGTDVQRLRDTRRNGDARGHSSATTAPASPPPGPTHRGRRPRGAG